MQVDKFNATIDWIYGKILARITVAMISRNDVILAAIENPLKEPFLSYSTESNLKELICALIALTCLENSRTLIEESISLIQELYYKDLQKYGISEQNSDEEEIKWSKALIEHQLVQKIQFQMCMVNAGWISLLCY